MKYNENWKWGTSRFFPHEMSLMIRVVLITMTVTTFLVFFWPTLLMPPEEPANPLNTPEHIKPEWYFVAAYQGLKLFPSDIIGISIQVIVLLAMFSVPFWDRKKERNIKRKPVLLTLSLIGIAVFIVLTTWGMMI